MVTRCHGYSSSRPYRAPVSSYARRGAVAALKVVYCAAGLVVFFACVVLGLAGLILQGLSEHGLRGLRRGWDFIDRW